MWPPSQCQPGFPKAILHQPKPDTPCHAKAKMLLSLIGIWNESNSFTLRKDGRTSVTLFWPPLQYLPTIVMRFQATAHTVCECMCVGVFLCLWMHAWVRVCFADLNKSFCSVWTIGISFRASACGSLAPIQIPEMHFPRRCIMLDGVFPFGSHWHSGMGTSRLHSQFAPNYQVVSLSFLTLFFLQPQRLPMLVIHDIDVDWSKPWHCHVLTSHSGIKLV